MYGVVNEGGTGASAQIAGIELCRQDRQRAANFQRLCAKSNKALAETMKDNGWFVGFAPAEHPEIVVVALWEAGEHGALAAPIVRDVIKAYFDKKARQSNPPQQVALFRRPRCRSRDSTLTP